MNRIVSSTKLLLLPRCKLLCPVWGSHAVQFHARTRWLMYLRRIPGSPESNMESGAGMGAKRRWHGILTGLPSVPIDMWRLSSVGGSNAPSFIRKMENIHDVLIALLNAPPLAARPYTTSKSPSHKGRAHVLIDPCHQRDSVLSCSGPSRNTDVPLWCHRSHMQTDLG